jgi:hypothetical protein
MNETQNESIFVCNCDQPSSFVFIKINDDDDKEQKDNQSIYTIEVQNEE